MSYQKDGTSALPMRQDANGRSTANYKRVIISVATVLALVSFVAALRWTSSPAPPLHAFVTTDQAGGIWGSSKEKLKASPNTLTLPGFPPLHVQQEYLDELVKVDWDAVEADIAELLTNSQECKFLLSLRTRSCR